MSERTIFLAALDITDLAQRKAYLQRACGGDAVLRKQIEALLAAHERDGEFLDVPALAQVAASSSPPASGGSGEAADPEGSAGLPFLTPSSRPGSLGRLRHYEVLKVVGKGGMGVVLRTFDDKLHRLVAIKALAPHLATSGSARQRFVREARAAAAVTHDNVIDIHAVEDDGAVPYLVMQFIDGPTLQQKLDQIGPLPLKEVLRIGLQVAWGLAAAHKQGLVHRDVKPANILLENGVERVKLTDFGLARAVDDASLTAWGIVAGTPAYMSPEQAGAEHVDHRSDLFSLGSVLYAMCTGHPPFRAATTLAVLKRVCDHTPRPPREVNPDVPDWLAAIIARLHAKSPEKRFQTAAEVAELLSRHLAQLQQPGMGAGPVGHVSDLPGQQARWQRVPRVAVLALLGLAALAGSVAVSWISWRPGAAPDRANATTDETPPWKPRPVPSPEELARLPAPADTLRREDIPAELLAKAGGGDKDKAPPELVAVFGEDRHAGGDRRNHLYAAAISPDGRTLAFGGIEKVARQIDLATGKPRQELTWKQRTAEDCVYTLAFSPDGKVLACGGGAGSIVLWDVTTGVEPRLLASPEVTVAQIAFSPDGALLATAGQNNGGILRVWNVATGQLLFTARPAANWAAWCVAFSPDGKTLAAGLDSGEVRLWDVATGGEVARLSGLGGRVRWLGFHPDGRSLAVAGGLPENVVYVWDLATRTPRHRLSGHGSGVLAGAWRADGRLLITAGSTDGTVRLWDLSGDRPRSRALAVIPPDVPWLHGIALSPEGRHLAVCNPNGTVYVLRLAGRGEVLRLPAEEAR